MIQGKAYHRFFEGYSERRVWDAGKQRFRIEKYYSGDYYRAELSEEERKRGKGEYFAGYVSALVLFVMSSVIKTESNASTAVAVSTLIVLLGLLWLLPSLFAFLRAKELLVMREYRERKNFMSLSMGLACFSLLNAGVHLGFLFWFGAWGKPGEWFCIAACLLDAIIFYRIYKKETEVEYHRIINEEKIPQDCYDITFREE